jgi:signal transduction histidine kinase/ligand-binding sensor domain-containing protein
MRAPIAAAAALGLLAGAQVSSARPEVDLARPSVATYGERDGLPQGTIHAVTFDSRGYLWVGTQDGAARFDGRSWHPLDMPDRAVSNYVRTVVGTRDGSLWFGREEGGVVRRRDGVTEVFDGAAGLPSGRVNHLLEGADGTLWAATHGGGVARFDGTKFAPVGSGLPDPRVWSLLERRDASGKARLVAACEGGVAELGEGGRFATIGLGTSLAGFSANALLETDDDGERSLWVGTFGAGLFRVRAGGVTRFGPDEGLGSRFVTSLASTGPRGSETVWVGTRDAGLYRLRGRTFEPVALGADPLSIYALSGGGVGAAETLWVGTRLSGLLRVQPTPWAPFDADSGLPGDQVFSFLETRGAEGRPEVWIGTSRGAALLRGGQLSVHGPATALPAGEVRSFTEVRGPGESSELWVSLTGAGIFRRDGARWRPIEARPAFRSDDASVLLATRDETGRPVVWAGSERSGLGRFAAGRWTTLGESDGLPARSVLSLLETRSPPARTLWAGTRGGGLAELSGGRVVRVHDRTNGLPNNVVLALAEVTLPGGPRELWVGTRGGLARRSLDDPGAAWSVLTGESRPPLPSDVVLSIAPVPGGPVYLGTNRGVARLDLSRSGGGLEVAAFGTNEGLPSAACNQGSLVDGAGRVWISTAAGAALFDPARVSVSEPSPHPLVLERFVAGGAARPIDGAVTLRRREADVAFEYALLAYHGQSLVRYRTQLQGREAVPTEWTTAHIREYTNLPPGEYVFRVWGRDADATVSGPLEIPFRVTQAFWRRPAALVLWSLLAAAVGLAIVHLRERRLRRKAGELEALVRLRTRELETARDAAQAAMESKARFLAHMSHEVRTPLSAVLGYADLLADELRDRGVDDLLPDVAKIERAARQQLSLVNEALDLSKLEAGGAELHLTEFDAEALVREAAETAWPLLKKGRNRLETRGVDGLGRVLSDEGKLRQVLLNLLSNAARFTEGGTITVEAGIEGGVLTVRVADTGIGMTPEQRERIFTPFAQASPGHAARFGGTGLGLVISRGYCELLHGSLDLASEPGVGSTFTVRVPARLDRRGTGR